MLNFLVENIPEAGFELSQEETPPALGLEEDKIVSYIGTLSVELMLEKIGARVKAKGRVKFKVRMTCVRCLEPFFENFISPLDITYEPEPVKKVSDASLSEDESDVFYYGENGLIEMGNAVREFVMLSLPLKPLCMPDCPGLCPYCGGKSGSCSCGIKQEDPRFSKLRGYKIGE